MFNQVVRDPSEVVANMRVYQRFSTSASEKQCRTLVSYGINQILLRLDCLCWKQRLSRPIMYLYIHFIAIYYVNTTTIECNANETCFDLQQSSSG